MALALGCVGVVVVGIAIGVILIALNWSSILGLATGATKALPDLVRAKSAVAAYCKGGTVHLAHKTQSKNPDATLGIELHDCRSFDEISPGTPEADMEARRVAQVAYGSLVEKERYRHFEVDVTMDHAAKWQADPHSAFEFDASELRSSP